MYRPQIVIHLHAGQIQQVYSSDRDVEVIAVDWDVSPVWPRSNTVAVEMKRRTLFARVGQLTPLPLHELAGSQLERAVEAAFEQGILAEPAF